MDYEKRILSIAVTRLGGTTPSLNAMMLSTTTSPMRMLVSKVEEPKEAEVIDLMEALRRSLGEGVAPRRRTQARSGKAPAARKTPARKRAS